MDNALYYGDNLGILREHFSDEAVDLIYLDPPFNSKADYNILFKEQSGEPSEGQIRAFTDSWHWSERAYAEFIENCHNEKLSALMEGFINTLGRNEVTAYLVMMAPRLLELHRVLKPTGSLYLHCDPTASHYLKLILDCVFGPRNFLNEITWKRTFAHSGSRRWGPVHDTLFYYRKQEPHVWNRELQGYSEKYIQGFYRHSDASGRYQSVDLTGAGIRKGASGKPWKGIDPTEAGRHWAAPNRIIEEQFGKKALKLTVQQKLDLLEKHGLILWPAKGKIPRFKRYLMENGGYPIVDVITDIGPIGAHAGERLGYPTQKPQALLERIIRASSNEGDVVLDPFCGCGTAVAAAQALKRKWIGIDITHLAVSLIQARLRDMFDLKPKADYQVVGVPEDEASAWALAERDRFEFQKWAVSLVPNAYPTESKTADKGIDGRVNFTEVDEKKKTVSRKVVIQVKSGKLTASAVRDFRGVIEREKAALGLFISLEPPSEQMRVEAGSMGFYETMWGGRKVQRYQIQTVAELLAGKSFDIPQSGGAGTHGIARAPRQKKKDEQRELDL